MNSQTIWWHFDQMVDDIEIFTVDLAHDPSREELALQHLDADEMARFQAFRVDSARRQFLLSRACLRLMIAKRLDIDPSRLRFCHSPYGKPYAVVEGEPAPVSFNISHSGEYGLFVVTESRCVGIDLEERRSLDDHDAIAAQVFGDHEKRALFHLSGAKRLDLFYRLWTCKEALIKARGSGFSYNPSRFQVPDAILEGKRTASFCFPNEEAVRWSVTDLSGQRYAAALAYRCNHLSS
ncbi:MAG: 4'-phosphopantetheinyl transferase superfamily protein [Pseudomonadota bacterium]